MPRTPASGERKLQILQDWTGIRRLSLGIATDCAYDEGVTRSHHRTKMGQSKRSRSSRHLLQPIPLKIEGDYGEVRGLAWWLYGGEIRFSCRVRVLPGRPRLILLRVAGEDPIPLEVMVRKASTAPATGDVVTYWHKGRSRLMEACDEPRLRRIRQLGDPAHPVPAPTITGSVTPKRRRRKKTLPSGQALREAMARGRGLRDPIDWWAPEGVPVALDAGDPPAAFLDLTTEGHTQRCLDRHDGALYFHVEPLHQLALAQELLVVVQYPDRTFGQFPSLVQRHHLQGTILVAMTAEVRTNVVPSASVESHA